jgi:hypothetical protein
MAKDKTDKDQKDKGKKSKKGKDGDAQVVEADAGAPTIAAHPRAARAVARSKSWGGLVGFVLAGYLSLHTSTVAETMLRALIGGLVCYVAVWAGAVFLWRRLIVLELKGREHQLHAAKASAPRELPPPRAARAAANANAKAAS